MMPDGPSTVQYLLACIHHTDVSQPWEQFLAESKHSVNHNDGNDDGDDGSFDNDGLKNKLSTFIRYRFG